MDYLSAVQEAYGSDVQDAVSEASSNNVDLRLKELRYVVVVVVVVVVLAVWPPEGAPDLLHLCIVFAGGCVFLKTD